MSREWKPGDLVVVAHMRAFYMDGNEGPMFTFADGSRARADVVPADPARPFAVIDPQSVEDVARLGKVLSEWGYSFDSTPEFFDLERDVSCLAAALRTFADPPPQIKEPTEFGARVRDARGVNWVRTYQPGHGEKPWCTGNHHGTWADVDAVEVLPEGGTP